MQAKLQPILSQILLPWQRGSVVKKCNWQHSMAHSRKLLYRHKNLAKISYVSRVIAHFVQNFVAMGAAVEGLPAMGPFLPFLPSLVFVGIFVFPLGGGTLAFG